MKQAFITKRFEDTSLALIGQCNEVVTSYLAQGLRLTLRQIYYQLVSSNIIVSNAKLYKSLGNLLKDARMAGLVDWDAIEDRGRRPIIPTEFDDLADLLEAAVRSYRLPRWEGQDYYIELWVEKDALSNILAPLADEYHVTLMVDKGYQSASALYETAQKRFGEHSDQKCVLLYLGDHDPSGLDMERDIRKRLTILSNGNAIPIERVAITWDQVHEYGLPANPAKKSDSRYKVYIAKYGYECWEVDALPPVTLQGLIRQAIENHLDKEALQKVKDKEESDKTKLRGFIDSINLDNGEDE